MNEEMDLDQLVNFDNSLYDQLEQFCDDLETPNNNIRVESDDLFPDEVNEHTVLVDPVKFEPTFEKKWFKCEQCKYKTRDGENLKRHLSLKHGHGGDVPWFYCDQCTYKTLLKSALNVHKRHKHVPEDMIKWFSCNQCDYKTKTKSCLVYHRFQHVNPESIQWHTCTHCDYKAKTKSRLNKHVSELHSAPGDIKWLKCEYCLMYITRRNSSLKLHIRRKHSEFLK